MNEERGLNKSFAEFFAGIGLVRMGLEQSGWDIAFSNDIDPIKEKLYNEHFKDEAKHFKLGDIHALNVDSIPTVSLATASFPCTDLSLAGKRKGLSGPQSSALWGFIEVLNQMGLRRPPIILLENVEGFLTSNGGNDFKSTLISLNNLGYTVDAFIINAAHFVPQSRKRLFVVGKLENKSSIILEEQLAFYDNKLRPKKLLEFIKVNKDINWALKDLPSLPKLQIKLSDIIDSSGDWWDQERVDYLLNQTSTKHIKVINNLIDNKEYSFLTAFRRVRNGRSMAEIRSDGIAGCLRTPKGGSARQILVRVGFGEVKVRLLSGRECAKLMGADDFNVSTNLNEALFGFGDAVCVPVINWIAENYLNPEIQKLNNLNLSQNKSEYRKIYSRV